ncbi:hypothetical protein ACFOSC_00800 [Streptantibioticus rubrisoli]|uniref:Pycsar effector protein domain-containing protein n=1 Tax=Streptantibioticus rubrisoli TaxID=1387313 RepID=A0ABT1PD80_9ACTN|nr:hypothetical protein [Streptantibioticus rubrisoli]MCQ4043329.1 hypothetical protein [Streptantibioticus rubrisoli]
MSERQPAEELVGAMAAMASFQQVTQQADAKAGTLVTVHIGLAAVVATQVGQAGAPAPTCPSAVLFWMVGLAYAVTFVVSGYLLIQVIRPRAANPGAPNHFSLDASDHLDTRPDRLVHDAWATAHAIARIAELKNSYTARAVIWVAATVIAAGAWLVLAETLR